MQKASSGAAILGSRFVTRHATSHHGARTVQDSRVSNMMKHTKGVARMAGFVATMAIGSYASYSGNDPLNPGVS